MKYRPNPNIKHMIVLTLPVLSFEIIVTEGTWVLRSLEPPAEQKLIVFYGIFGLLLGCEVGGIVHNISAAMNQQPSTY